MGNAMQIVVERGQTRERPMTYKHRFDISPNMTVLWGQGDLPSEAEGLHAICMTFVLGADREPSLLTIGSPDDAPDADIVFLVDPDGCRAVLGDAPQATGTWHLSTVQRAVAHAIMGCGLAEPAATTVRTIKSIELLWAITDDLAKDRMILADYAHLLSEQDTLRILQARRLIDESWEKKLTLNTIARASGVNRVKLTQGFRALFDCTVAEAIAEHRLNGAYSLLLSTDLPVSSIGYRCGYSNNAAFTRAFSRRFGMVPTQVRAAGTAA